MQGDDTLDGGAGNDLLRGGEGSDTFLFGKGSGQDSIEGVRYWDETPKLDQVILGAGIQPEDVSIEYAYSQDQLTLSITETGDQLVIQDALNPNGSRINIDQIQFADGSLWTAQAFKNEFLTGTTGHDSLLGFGEDDHLSGLAGNDLLHGYQGNDTLEGGTGADQLYGDEGDDLLIDTAGFNRLDGGYGNDSLTGQGLFNGGSGQDTLTASSRFSADTYLFNRGDAQDLIIEQGLNSTPAFGMLGRTEDTLLFGSGIDSSQIWFSQNGNDLDIQLIGTDDRIRIQDWYLAAAHRVELFGTADGKTLHDSQVDALVSAMAAFAPPASGETSLPTQYQNALNTVIAANWQ